MGGSYRHVTDTGGNFTDMDCIDNLGDAHDALEECVEMIHWLASGNPEVIYQAYLHGYLAKHYDYALAEDKGSGEFWEDE